ncbi:MAG: radical SAM/SPASM domain-containing protein [Candidatus Thorarchaeota archaeon]
MVRERIVWKLFGKRLVSYRKLEDGEIIGTGFLNPIIDRFRLITMFIAQAKFYKNYDLGRWRGKRVANTFAPPVGSRAMFRAMKNVIRGRMLRHVRPIAMTFAVTYKCQCSCIHCSAGKHEKVNTPELSTEEAKKAIEESQKLGISILAFTGGEPLLRPDIFELISHVNQKKTVPILFTNGQFLTQENVDKLSEAGLYSLFVSIDSPVPDEHNKLRGIPGLFETAIEGIKRAKEKGIFVGFSSYATRTSTREGKYKKIHDLAKTLGLHNVMLFDGVPTGKILKDTSELLTMEQREEIREFSSHISKNQVVPPLSSQSWQNSIESYLAGIGCLAAYIQYYLSAYGEVTPCDFAPLSFGNIRVEPLKKIWKRMIHHPAYKHRVTFCRMQNAKFRYFYIDPIPDDAPLPYDITKLPRVDYRKKVIPETTQISSE